MVVLDRSASSHTGAMIDDYQWTWSGESASGISPQVTLPVRTQFITLSTTGSDGTTSTDTVVVEVSARSFENAEDFFVEFWSDGVRHVVGRYVNSVDFPDNGTFYHPSIVIDSVRYVFGEARLRFRADASGNSHWVYIDEVAFSAR